MTNATAAESPHDTGHQDPVPVAIFGRCLLPNTLEIPCQAVNISPYEIEIVAGHSPNQGDHIIIYLDHVGRIEGDVDRIVKNGFGLKLQGTPRYREKLAERINWLGDNANCVDEDIRRHDRIQPKDSNSEIKLNDGRTYPVEIIDISLSGAAVQIEEKPAIGCHVTLAGMQGQVVRHFAEGIAIEFARVVPITTLESRV